MITCAEPDDGMSLNKERAGGRMRAAAQKHKARKKRTKKKKKKTWAQSKSLLGPHDGAAKRQAKWWRRLDLDFRGLIGME